MSKTFTKHTYMYKALLIKVIDGDTIDVRLDVGFETHLYKRLRFLDIDTEEMNSSDPARRVKALAAKDKVKELIADATYLAVETVMDATGKYGRVLANVWVEIDSKMLCINDYLYENGFQKLRD